MHLAEIEQLLKDTMGLSAASIGSSSIKRAVDQRMRERKIADTGDYLQRLRGSNVELTSLIDLVVVPETWFFRDSHPFKALAQYGVERLAKGNGAPLRILSVPCSTGEEPYTIAMALLDAGLTRERFQIDAVDISEPNLERARSGLYRENSFRGDDKSFRDRHFLKSEQGYLLKQEVRDAVRLRQGNLLAPGFLSGEALYDIIFCRNLLIYFDRQTQAHAVDVLEGLLQKQGLLFLGHAEAGVLSGRNFAPLGVTRSFAFVQGSAYDSASLELPHMFDLPKRRRSLRRPAVAQRNPLPKYQPETAPPEPARDVADNLEVATRLANEGHLAEAAVLCHRHLETQGPDAQAFYLLAMLRQATGEQADAENYLRKALYLDPNHYEALTHLAGLLEQRGDAANAELIRQRARRSFERRQHEAAGGTRT